jgi:hypothetical protein
MTLEEEYRLFLDYTIRMIERRGSITTTYLSVNAAVIGAIAFVFKDLQLVETAKLISGLVLIFAGLVACILWRKLIVQYSTLLKWWYERLREIEDQLPASSHVLKREYSELYATGKTRGKRPPDVSLTDDETWLSTIFMLLYLIAAAVIVALLLA